jgi:hypothetical protein
MGIILYSHCQGIIHLARKDQFRTGYKDSPAKYSPGLMDVGNKKHNNGKEIVIFR